MALHVLHEHAAKTGLLVRAREPAARRDGLAEGQKIAGEESVTDTVDALAPQPGIVRDHVADMIELGDEIREAILSADVGLGDAVNATLEAPGRAGRQRLAEIGTLLVQVGLSHIVCDQVAIANDPLVPQLLRVGDGDRRRAPLGEGANIGLEAGRPAIRVLGVRACPIKAKRLGRRRNFGLVGKAYAEPAREQEGGNKKTDRRGAALLRRTRAVSARATRAERPSTVEGGSGTSSTSSTLKTISTSPV